MVDVGTSSVVVSQARNELGQRNTLVIRNISPNSADIITVNLGQRQATADAGIVLNKGESFSESKSAGYKNFQGVITAICATANGKLAVFER